MTQLVVVLDHDALGVKIFFGCERPEVFWQLVEDMLETRKLRKLKHGFVYWLLLEIVQCCLLKWNVGVLTEGSVWHELDVLVVLAATTFEA